MAGSAGYGEDFDFEEDEERLGGSASAAYWTVQQGQAYAEDWEADGAGAGPGAGAAVQAATTRPGVGAGPVTDAELDAAFAVPRDDGHSQGSLEDDGWDAYGVEPGLEG
jgi:hypothetical protein